MSCVQQCYAANIWSAKDIEAISSAFKQLYELGPAKKDILKRVDTIGNYSKYILA